MAIASGRRLAYSPNWGGNPGKKCVGHALWNQEGRHHHPREGITGQVLPLVMPTA